MRMQMPQVLFSMVAFKGGMDQVTSPLDLKPGYLSDGLNFECVQTGGYARCGGFERIDGRAKPSDATYTLVQVTSFTNTPTVGQTLSNTPNTASGVIIAIGSNYMALTKVTGTFSSSEAVDVAGTAIGTTTPLTVQLTAKQNAQYLNLAADSYRADITAVPGSGAVRGVKMLGDIRYAFRNNAGGTAVDLYKSSSSGWVQVAFEYEIGFSNANTSVADGDTLTQGGVTATIRRVLVQTGTLVSGVNTGRLVISAPAGGNFAAGAATSTGAGALTLSAIQTAITMAVGGKFEIVRGNFSGGVGGLRLYGCDGVNRAFEFDGSYFVPIDTGTDVPKHLIVFKAHLFYSAGSDCVNSGINDPYNFTSTAGGARKSIGDTLTGFIEQPGTSSGGALTIFGRRTTTMMYGSAASGTGAWNFVTYNNGVGAYDYSMQQMAQTHFLDNSGVTSLTASQVYGNFDSATLTSGLLPFIKSKRGLVSCSSISRERGQYRLFFTDGYALYCTIVNGKFIGAIPQLFDIVPYCASDDIDSSGNEVLLIGATNGMVYQLDKGSSFDGNDINAYLTFNWNHAGSPRLLKRWRKGSIEMQGSYYSEIQFGYSLEYGSTDEMQPGSSTYSSNFASSNWDSFTWDLFTWDTQTLLPNEVELLGTSTNIRISISTTHDYLQPFTINNGIYHYTPRRAVR